MNLKRVFLLVSGLVAVTTLGASLFRAAGSCLVRDDRPGPGAPFVAVLLGDQSPARAAKALAVASADPKATVLMARERGSGFVALGVAPSLADMYADLLLQGGIAPERIVVIPGCNTTSTAEEARCLLAYIQGTGVTTDRLPLITSWYHTSRAHWLFEKTFRDSGIRIEMIPAYPEGLDVAAWWRGEDSFLAVFTEYLKWAYWLAR